MNETQVLYIIVVIWLAPWIISTIYLAYKFNRLNTRLKKFLDDNVEDDLQE